MKILLLDGHPDAGRFAAHLLDCYAASLPASAEVTRVAVRDLAFTPGAAPRLCRAHGVGA